MVWAEAVSGSEATFVAAMNERARALGLGQSYFVNPTGLPDPRQTTSVRTWHSSLRRCGMTIRSIIISWTPVECGSADTTYQPSTVSWPVTGAPTDLRPVRPATPATISSPLRNATGSGSCSRTGRSRLRYTQRSHGRAAQRGIRLSRWLHWRPQGLCSRFSILGNSFVGEIDRSTERHALSWRLLVPTDSEE